MCYAMKIRVSVKDYVALSCLGCCSPILVWEELRLRSTGRFRYIATLPNGCASGLEGTHFISDRGWQTCPGPTLHSYGTVPYPKLCVSLLGRTDKDRGEVK